MTTKSRVDALKDLMYVRTPVGSASRVVREFGWDYDEELVTLGFHEVRNDMELALNGDLSPEQLEEWANAVEGRDDIEFDPPLVIDIIAELSNPAIFEPINPNALRAWIARINYLQ